MTNVTVNLHRISSMKANSHNGTHWLTISTVERNTVTLFLKAHEAEALQEAWEDTQREPDLPTYDEALGAKCDAEARYRHGPPPKATNKPGAI